MSDCLLHSGSGFFFYRFVAACPFSAAFTRHYLNIFAICEKHPQIFPKGLIAISRKHYWGQLQRKKNTNWVWKIGAIGTREIICIIVVRGGEMNANSEDSLCQENHAHACPLSSQAHHLSMTFCREKDNDRKLGEVMAVYCHPDNYRWICGIRPNPSSILCLETMCFFSFDASFWNNECPLQRARKSQRFIWLLKMNIYVGSFWNVSDNNSLRLSRLKEGGILYWSIWLNSI